MGQERKVRTHEKMVDAAGRQFRAHGYDGIGVAGLAKAAGMTTGAFYDHFGSKDGAFTTAVLAGLDEVIAAIPAFQAEHGEGWLEAFADYYLGRAHRADAECVCAMTSLSPDVVRGGADLKQAYEKKMKTIVRAMAEGLSGADARAREERAWQALSLLIGGLTLSRAVHSKALGDRIALSVKGAVAAIRD